jgi:hypothetical protein
MSKFVIRETITFTVEADTAQEALDDWLSAGEEAPGYQFGEVEDREVIGPDGKHCVVED